MDQYDTIARYRILVYMLLIGLVIGYLGGLYKADSAWMRKTVETGHAQVVEGEWMWAWECGDAS